jgi:pyruvate/2-oxoglutarate dehydrogenase complex dihydrolipoamide dehydrogenase (E3) component
VAEHRPDICVIGAGSAGLSVAAGAAQMGASVVLIERGAMGGDCLNSGCVPSKALLAAAHQTEAIRRARRFGISATPAVDFVAVHAHVHGVIASIAPHDSVARFEGLGVTVIKADARFTSRATVTAGGDIIRARRFVIASGSRPAIPPIAGLNQVGYLTNETIFELKDRPDHLVIIGGGPIGCELAQAFRRLGAAVTLIEAMTILPKDDPALTAIVREQLLSDGVALHEKANVAHVAKEAAGVAVTLKSGARIAGSHLLVATGRVANADGLGLETAGVTFTHRGITVNASLRTTNRRVYAIGDCIGGPQFTHVAGYHAGIVIREMLFRLPAKADHRTIPAVTYTDPELAQVGMTEAAAREVFGARLRILTSPFAENDRARAERKDKGFIKVVATPRGQILGVGIVGTHAGELIQPWVLAMAHRLKVGALATIVAPYPTLGEINKRAAGTFFTPSLYGPRVRALVRFLSRFG